MKWKVLSSTYVTNAPWAVLRKDVCEMPSGKVVPEYYVLEYPNWVNAVAVTEQGEIILVKQYRHGVEEEVLEIPGGVIDDGEDPREAIQRELLEETGYAFHDIQKLVDLYPNPATSNNTTTSYLAIGGVKTHEQSLDDHEEIEVILVTPEKARQLLKENKFGQALHTAALFYGLSALEEL